MNRRLFSLALLAGLLFLPTYPVRGQGDDDDDDDDESGSGGDDDDDSGSSDGDDDSGSDGDDDVGTGGNGSSQSSGRDGDQDEAKRAVETEGAIPLDEMLAIFAQRGTYTILDVKLQRSNDTFLYVIKFIDQQTVRKSFFDARTGVLVK